MTGAAADAATEPDRPRRPGVFLSHGRADRARVALLARALEGAGYEVWWDALIEGGAAFARRIEEKLAASDAVVVVWSRASAGSDWVADEATLARDAGKLVPVTIDGILPPIGFRQYHAVDLAHWKGDRTAPEFQAVCAGIAAVAGAARAAGGAPPRRGPLLSRRAALAGGGALAAAAATGALILVKPWQSPATGNSVAVLPFRNLSGNPAQAYFSDGLAEEVRAALGRNPALKVAAPTSSNLFRAADEDAKIVGDRLDVAFLLEGSVRKSGRTVRVGAQLVDTATGFTTWTEDFERRLDDVFAVQSEVAARVAEALAVRVAQPLDVPGGTRNGDAYNSYLRGRALFDADEGEVSDRAALARFEAALALDPDYAAAHAARSRSLAAIATQYAGAGALRGMYDEAIRAGRRAVAIAPDLAAAHLALAYAIFTGRLDFRASRAPFERAAALGKGDADILVLFALYDARAGRAGSASAAVRRAVELDPLNPRAWRAVASVAYAARRYAEVRPPAERALALNPKLSNARALIANALLVTGKAGAARAAYEAEPNQSFRLAGLAVAKRRLGDRAGAEAAKAELVAEFGDSALYQQAQIFAQAGEIEPALAALARARQVGNSGLLYMATDPFLDPLRGSPAYASLTRGMGLS